MTDQLHNQVTSGPPGLDEPAIQRFSRQILLAEVGGVGQRALLSQRFVLDGAGIALTTAAAYLEGAGCALVTSTRAVRPQEVGYRLGHADVGAPVCEAIGTADFDAQPGVPDGLLGELPLEASPCAPTGPRVVIGRLLRDGAIGAVASSAAGGCSACFDLALARLQPGLSGALAVQVGSYAALVAQRLVLELEEGVALHVVSSQAGQEEEVERCSRCR